MYLSGCSLCAMLFNHGLNCVGNGSRLAAHEPRSTVVAALDISRLGGDERKRACRKLVNMWYMYRLSVAWLWL